MAALLTAGLPVEFLEALVRAVSTPRQQGETLELEIHVDRCNRIRRAVLPVEFVGKPGAAAPHQDS